MDEKSGYVIGVPICAKNFQGLLEGLKSIVFTLNSDGHKVDRITTDDEKIFHTVKPLLGQLGIQLEQTPAGQHERRIWKQKQTSTLFCQ